MAKIQILIQKIVIQRKFYDDEELAERLSGAILERTSTIHYRSQNSHPITPNQQQPNLQKSKSSIRKLRRCREKLLITISKIKRESIEEREISRGRIERKGKGEENLIYRAMEARIGWPPKRKPFEITNRV